MPTHDEQWPQAKLMDMDGDRIAYPAHECVAEQAEWGFFGRNARIEENCFPYK